MCPAVSPSSKLPSVEYPEDMLPQCKIVSLGPNQTLAQNLACGWDLVTRLYIGAHDANADGRSVSRLLWNVQKIQLV